jgi:hypothetical protein
VAINFSNSLGDNAIKSSNVLASESLILCARQRLTCQIMVMTPVRMPMIANNRVLS